MIVLELTDNVLILEDRYTQVSTVQMNSIKIKHIFIFALDIVGRKTSSSQLVASETMMNQKSKKSVQDWFETCHTYYTYTFMARAPTYPLQSVAPVLIEVSELSWHLPESLSPLSLCLSMDQISKPLHLQRLTYIFFIRMATFIALFLCHNIFILNKCWIQIFFPFDGDDDDDGSYSSFISMWFTV